MTKDDIISYLRAMEQQFQKYYNQDARVRSIQQSIDNLRQEMKRNKRLEHLTMPAWPDLEEPKPVGDGFSYAIVAISYICIFALFCGIMGSELGSEVLTAAFFLSFFPAILTGNIGKKSRKRQAEEREAKRVEEVNQQRIDDWEKQKRNIINQNCKIDEQNQKKYELNKRIALQISELKKNYDAAVQARQQIWDKFPDLAQPIGLHSDYWTPYALEQIRSLLEHGRADTLKEALNRYESEEAQRQHHSKMEKYESQRAYHQKQAAEAAQRQAAYAQEQAFYQRQAAEYAEQQREYARQQVEYERRQAQHTAETRDDVAAIKRDVDRIFGR